MFLIDTAQEWKEKRFLCMRRDVSNVQLLAQSIKQFSLHAQRCFFDCLWTETCGKVFSACAEMFHLQNIMFQVFSACAEMFLYMNRAGEMAARFLCMRRDVSYDLINSGFANEFSLHAQRCF